MPCGPWTLSQMERASAVGCRTNPRMVHLTRRALIGSLSQSRAVLSGAQLMLSLARRPKASAGWVASRVSALSGCGNIERLTCTTVCTAPWAIASATFGPAVSRLSGARIETLIGPRCCDYHRGVPPWPRLFGFIWRTPPARAKLGFKSNLLL